MSANGIYISGPITGCPGLNKEAFKAAEVALTAKGYRAVNPHEVNPTPGLDWADYMRSDIIALMGCHGVAYLPEHYMSPGATIECELAKALGMPVGPLQEWLDLA